MGGAAPALTRGYTNDAREGKREMYTKKLRIDLKEDGESLLLHDDIAHIVYALRILWTLEDVNRVQLSLNLRREELAADPEEDDEDATDLEDESCPRCGGGSDPEHPCSMCRGSGKRRAVEV